MNATVKKFAFIASLIMFASVCFYFASVAAYQTNHGKTAQF
jgi:hypothetical protein